MNLPLQIPHPPMPPIHFVGERLPGAMAAVKEAFGLGIDVGATSGGLAGLTVGSILGAAAASLVWVFILFCAVLLFSLLLMRKR